MIFAISLFFASCDKSDDQKENVLEDNAHIIDILDVQHFDGSVVTMNASSLDFSPAPGDILLASPSDAIPTGLLSKVVSVENAGSELKLTVVPSTLPEAFRQLYIDYRSDNEYQSEAQLRGATLNVPFNEYSLAPSVTVQGNMQLNMPEVEIRYQLDEGDALPKMFRVLANVNTSGSEISVKAQNSVQVPEKTLHTFQLPLINVPVVVAGVPLVIPFRQSLDVNTLPAAIGGKMKLSVRPTMAAHLGLQYKNGNWENLSGLGLKGTAEKPLQADFESEMQASLTFFTPVYRIGPAIAPSLYAFFKVPNTLEAKIQTETPNYLVKYNLGVEAGVHFDFWLGLSGERSLSVPVFSKVLTEGNFGNIIIDLSEAAAADNQASFTIEDITLTASINWEKPAGWNDCTDIDPTARLSFTPFGGLAPTNVIIADLSELDGIRKIRVVYFNNSGDNTTFVCCADGTTIAEAHGGNGGDEDITLDVNGAHVDRFVISSLEAIIRRVEIIFE